MWQLKKVLVRIFKYCKSSKSLSFGIFVLVILLILGFGLAPFAPFDPCRWGKVPRDEPPSLSHPLGTTTLGQDVFWLITRAIRDSLILGAVTAGLSMMIAMFMGFLAGYLNERVWGKIIDKIINGFSVIPGLPYLMVLAFAFKDYLNIVVIGLFLSTIGWAWPAKALRSIVLEMRRRTHVYTGIASGLSLSKLFVHEFLPYILPWIATQSLNLVRWSIGMETTLGVFGLSSMEKATIGTMLYWAMQYQALLRGIWWWLSMPIIVVVLLISSLYYSSMGLDELLNPKSRLSQVRRSTWAS
ncbi:ABC transporter permease [Candidatus Bathyarchaeota archaeon]|nr:MAG: ABC transporter permease [Candidatus Bathyarchaeota archaeon]